MGVTFPFTYPFHAATLASTSIVGKWDCALNGHTYMVDTSDTFRARFRHYSPELLRQQADSSPSPSEASINPDDLWRRSFDTWHGGAGQTFVDRGASDATRFNTSKGVNVWTKWQLSLLSDTGNKLASVNTNLPLTTAGTYLYVGDGQALKYTQDITVGSPTWTTVTGTHASTIQSMCSDGNTVYLAQGGGIYSTTRGAAACTGTPFNALVCTLVRYVNGRLMAANANNVYNVTASGAAPVALYPHPNADFTWVDFAEGQTVLYAAGYSGDRSIIYKTATKADGTALDIPTVAGTLPDGEIVRSIQGYLGFVVIGSDKGVRVASTDSAGNLSIGALIPTSSPVRCFEPQDRFVWYGLTNYDGVSTGLGRVDLSVETAALTPAYASDLMATTQGNVLSVVSFQNIRVFTVSGHGVYAELTTPVASGTWDSGQITYRMPDDKVAMFVDVRHDGIGQHSVSISSDGGAFTVLGTHTLTADPFPVGERRGFRNEIRLALTAVANVSPVIRSVTLRAYPAAATARLFDIPFLLHEMVTTADRGEESVNPGSEREYIIALHRDQEIVPYQEGDTQWSVTIKTFDWHPFSPMTDHSSWNGTMLTTLKEVK